MNYDRYFVNRCILQASVLSASCELNVGNSFHIFCDIFPYTYKHFSIKKIYIIFGFKPSRSYESEPDNSPPPTQYECVSSEEPLFHFKCGIK